MWEPVAAEQLLSEYSFDWDISGHNVVCDKTFKRIVCCGIFSAFYWLLTMNVSAYYERQETRARKKEKRKQDSEHGATIC